MNKKKYQKKMPLTKLRGRLRTRLGKILKIGQTWIEIQLKQGRTELAGDLSVIFDPRD